MCDSILNPSTRKGMIELINRLDRLEAASRRALNNPKQYMRRGPRTMWCSPMPDANNVLCVYNAYMNTCTDKLVATARRFDVCDWNRFILENGFDYELYSHEVLMEYFV